MRKAILMFVAVMLVSSVAWAGGNTGCGLGTGYRNGVSVDTMMEMELVVALVGLVDGIIRIHHDGEGVIPCRQDEIEEHECVLEAALAHVQG